MRQKRTVHQLFSRVSCVFTIFIGPIGPSFQSFSKQTSMEVGKLCFFEENLYIEGKFA